jgi:1,5-anhydro-D-fructose reductase (1,5-anhydro-D-mannitol-forming)
MKMNNKIRFAVIGSTGMIGSKAVPDAILAADNCELAAVQGLYREDVEPLAKTWNAPFYTDVEKMLNETDCDAVYVASPQSVHVEHVKVSAEHGFHVICEKPLARNGAEAEEMVNACKKAGVKFGTAFNLRYSNVHVKAKELIADGVIGDVVSARCQYGQNYPPDPDAFRQVLKLAGGGSMVDMGNHAIDLIEFVTGKRFNRVMAVAQNVIHKYEVEDSCAALLEFEDSGFAYVDAYYCIPLNILRNDLEVNGSRGILYTVDSLRGMVSGGTLFIKTVEKEEQYEFDGMDMYRTEFEAFADALLQEKDPPCTGDDGLHSQRLLDAIYKSARTGKKVKV